MLKLLKKVNILIRLKDSRSKDCAKRVFFENILFRSKWAFEQVSMRPNLSLTIQTRKLNNFYNGTLKV